MACPGATGVYALAHTSVPGQSREAEVYNARATSCFCPGLSQGLCLGQPWGSGSLGSSPREVGGWAGGGAFCWQAPVWTAVLCRCLWPSSVQCQGREPDSSVISLLGLLGGRVAGLGGRGLEGETRGARDLLALRPCPLMSGPGARWHREQSRQRRAGRQ